MGTHFPKEPSDEVAEDDGLVGLAVVGRGGNAGEVPQIRLPLVEPAHDAPGVEEQHPRTALDEPSAVEELDALVPHALEGALHLGRLWLDRFDLHRRRLVAERADEAIAVAIFLAGYRRFRLDDRVDTADCRRSQVISALPRTVARALAPLLATCAEGPRDQNAAA